MGTSVDAGKQTALANGSVDISVQSRNSELAAPEWKERPVTTLFASTACDLDQSENEEPTCAA
jgi:hypothetical protein